VLYQELLTVELLCACVVWIKFVAQSVKVGRVWRDERA